VKPALLVIDVQKRFFKRGPATVQSLDSAIEYINAAIAVFRDKGLPVVCVQHMNQGTKLVPDEDDFETSEKLKVLPSDLHVHKTYGNAFRKTSLESDLRKLGVDTVIVTGFRAEYCVLSTYRGAEDLDFTAVVLQDGLASSAPENIRFVESISEIISLGALEKALG
jgi:nicotinamidase-related amidase